jgi:hypothetical protein
MFKGGNLMLRKVPCFLSFTYVSFIYLVMPAINKLSPSSLGVVSPSHGGVTRMRIPPLGLVFRVGWNPHSSNNPIRALHLTHNLSHSL